MGRELDALVADMIFVRVNVRDTGLAIPMADDGWVWQHPSGRGHILAEGGDNPLEHFSTSIAAAWQVVEEMRERGFHVKVIVQACGAAHCQLVGYPERGGHVRPHGAHWDAPTAPEAICIAAIKALGVDLP